MGLLQFSVSVYMECIYKCVYRVGNVLNMAQRCFKIHIECLYLYIEGGRATASLYLYLIRRSVYRVHSN